MLKAVDFLVLWSQEGLLLPKKIYWEKSEYEIDHVSRIEPTGTKCIDEYTCRIGNRTAQLYCGSGQWFVMQKETAKSA